MAAPVPAFPSLDHDHARCVSQTLDEAERRCGARNQRLTAQRRRVLEIVAASHNAIGAYEILDRMADSGRRPAPITVYRALDFLMEQGLVHRLASLNAFVACSHPKGEHGAQFLICTACGMVAELDSDPVRWAIDAGAAPYGFQVADPLVEVAGVCVNCRTASGVGKAREDRGVRTRQAGS
jgi:Fur family zinc uptake transcriptional regulator